MIPAMPERKKKAIGYLAKSDDRASDAIRGLTRQNGWALDEIVVGGTVKRDECLRRLRHGEADALVLGYLRDISPALTDLSEVCRRAATEGWILTSADVPLRTDDVIGRALTRLLDAMMGFEKKDVGDRVRRAIRNRQAMGIRFGRPPVLPSPLVRQIRRARERGMTLQAIADDLNARRVPTAHSGAKWYPSTVRKVVRTAEAVGA